MGFFLLIHGAEPEESEPLRHTTNTADVEAVSSSKTTVSGLFDDETWPFFRKVRGQSVAAHSLDKYLNSKAFAPMVRAADREKTGNLGQMVVLYGRTGVGKSMLVREACARTGFEPIVLSCLSAWDDGMLSNAEKILEQFQFAIRSPKKTCVVLEDYHPSIGGFTIAMLENSYCKRKIPKPLVLVYTDTYLPERFSGAFRQRHVYEVAAVEPSWEDVRVEFLEAFPLLTERHMRHAYENNAYDVRRTVSDLKMHVLLPIDADQQRQIDRALPERGQSADGLTLRLKRSVFETLDAFAGYRNNRNCPSQSVWKRADMDFRRKLGIVEHFEEQMLPFLWENYTRYEHSLGALSKACDAIGESNVEFYSERQLDITKRAYMKEAACDDDYELPVYRAVSSVLRPCRILSSNTHPDRFVKKEIRRTTFEAPKRRDKIEVVSELDRFYPNFESERMEHSFRHFLLKTYDGTMPARPTIKQARLVFAADTAKASSAVVKESEARKRTPAAEHKNTPVAKRTIKKECV